MKTSAGMEVDDFARAVVERVLEGGELLLRELAEVGAFWQVSADQSVGVFIEPALPGAAGR